MTSKRERIAWNARRQELAPEREMIARSAWDEACQSGAESSAKHFGVRAAKPPHLWENARGGKPARSFWFRALRVLPQKRRLCCRTPRRFALKDKMAGWEAGHHQAASGISTRYALR